MKPLKDLLYRTQLEQVVGDTLVAIEGITFDSRAAGPQRAFVAVRGAQADGHKFIGAAVEQGAAAIICEDLPKQLNEGVTYVRVADTRHALAIMAGTFHGHPDRRLKLTGITGLHFALGVFTNITHDHLDYHGTFDAYIQAKKGFFDALPAEAHALVNADDVHGAVMVQNTKAAKCTYAVRNMADHRARIIENQLTGLLLNIDGQDMYSRLVGEFNASNLLAVYSAAVLLGQQPMDVLTALSNLEPPPGRFQVVRGQGGVIGIVDYAHTPDALKNVLTTIAAVCGDRDRVIIVVGCGGDRDRAKRPVMAAMAAAHSRTVVLTNDNPRSEDPMAIIGEMRKGLLQADLPRVFVNADRREAIRQAVGMAARGDVVLVAGKGHENYQEVNGVRTHFNDVEVLKETLELLRK